VKSRLLGILGLTAISAVLVAGQACLPVASAAAQAAAPLATTWHAGMAATCQVPGWPVLREGSNSAWPPVTVRSLQYLLNAHGARLAVDGAFGPKTKAAVVAFQRSHGLHGTGVVRVTTWRSVIITVRRGGVGSAVRAVQDQINFRNLKNGHTLNVDGIFGPKTEAAVRAFQEAMAGEVPGFTVDGIVGPQTWQALVTEALSS